jgi:hypothetical protein
VAVVASGLLAVHRRYLTAGYLFASGAGALHQPLRSWEKPPTGLRSPGSPGGGHP